MDSIAQYKREETWAPAEKKLAWIAFYKAFASYCAAIAQEARRMLETTTTPSEIFRVQEYLTHQRRIVDGLLSGLEDGYRINTVFKLLRSKNTISGVHSVFSS